MKVSLDLESTLADVATPFKDEYENRNGRRPKTWTEWDFKDVDFSISEFLEITTSNWKHRAHLIPLTEEGLATSTRRLYDAVDKLDIVTGRQGVEDEMKRWLEYHAISYNDFVTVSDQEAKANLGYDVLIDDANAHVDSVKPHQRLLLYSQPYNRSIILPDNCHRVNSFGEVLVHLLT